MYTPTFLNFIHSSLYLLVTWTRSFTSRDKNFPLTNHWVKEVKQFCTFSHKKKKVICKGKKLLYIGRGTKTFHILTLQYFHSYYYHSTFSFSVYAPQWKDKAQARRQSFTMIMASWILYFLGLLKIFSMKIYTRIRLVLDTIPAFYIVLLSLRCLTIWHTHLNSLNLTLNFESTCLIAFR